MITIVHPVDPDPDVYSHVSGVHEGDTVTVTFTPRRGKPITVDADVSEFHTWVIDLADVALPDGEYVVSDGDGPDVPLTVGD